MKSQTDGTPTETNRKEVNTMTKKEITNQLDRIAADSDYFVGKDLIRLTINDFEGFEDDWSEVERELCDEEAVEEVLNWLEENADSAEHDFYHCYHFGNIVVQVGYTSYDI